MLCFVQLDGLFFVGRVFKVGSEVLKMCIFGLFVFMLQSAKVAFLFVNHIADNSFVFEAQIVEHALRNLLTQFFEALAALSELSHTTNLEFMHAAVHVAQEVMKVLWNFVFVLKVLGVFTGV